MKTFLNYTPEEIIAAWERNQSFHGHHANLEKVRLYYKIKKELETLKDNCLDILGVNGYDPNPRERHAIIWADLRPIASFHKEDSDALSAIIKESDGITLAATDKTLRITFTIRDVWKD